MHGQQNVKTTPLSFAKLYYKCTLKAQGLSWFIVYYSTVYVWLELIFMED